ncbi:MAG: restriction endonuclease subunit S [Bifidobacterium pullorum]|uniref:restriction endonuclease subunit S n=1 Tax=Bifidobacterium pullorum TaxID=78448 RepID=UPI0039964F97
MVEKSNVPEIRFAGFADPWEQRKLGELADSFEYGLNVPASDFDGIHKYLRITDIDDETHRFNESDLTSPLTDLMKCEQYRLAEGDLLFARTGASVGKTYLYQSSDGLAYYAGFLIRAHIHDDASADFVFQSTLTERYRRFVSITSQRSGQPGINAKEYSEYEVPTPSLSEQRLIGRLFSRLDALITLHQRKYDKLGELKKSLLEKMFPKEGEVFPEIRFAGFADPWEQRKLGELFSYGGSGGTPSSSNDSFYGGKIPFLGISDVKGRDISHTAKHITENGLAASAAWVVPSGAVCLAMYASVGKVGIIRQNTATSQAFFNMVFDNDGTRDFVYSRLERAELTTEWESLISTGTQRNLNANKVRDFMLAVPAETEQRLIGSLFARLDSLITLHQRKLELLRNIKKALLDKMFVEGE